MAASVEYLKQDEHVAIVRLARPEALNALRREDITRLRQIFEAAARDDQIRALVLTGTGRAFCAGVDLKELGRDLPAAEGEHRARLAAVQDLSRAMVRHPAVIIAAVNGPALGMGAELCVAADIRLAAAPATFAFPEVQRGVFQTNGVTFLLPRLVGHGRAAHWLLTGTPVTAEQALAAGLVTGLFAPDRLMEAGVECARQIAQNAPVPVRLVKQALHAGAQHGFEAMLAREIEGVMQCFGTEDFREGVQAFVERRPPRYAGR